MTGLVRKATLLCVGGALLAGAAMAGVPNGTNSTIPDCITLSDGINPTAGILLVIRDGNNNPVAGSAVTVDFSGCYPPGFAAGNFLVYLAQPAGYTVTCLTKTVAMNADGLGQVSLTVLGGGSNIGTASCPATYAAPPLCAKIYADSQLLKTVRVEIVKYDLSNNSTMDGLDGTFWGDRFNCQTQTPPSTGDRKADYNCDSVIGGLDGTFWGDAFQNAMVVVATTPC